jgi:thiamine transport system ATP-binding protein
MLIIKALRYHYPATSQAPAKSFCYNFCAHPGEILGIAGQSGAGKTTLFNLLSGFLTAKSGEILLETQNLCRLKIKQRPLSYLMQDHPLFDHLSALDNMALGLNPALKLSPAEYQELLALAHAFELQDVGHQKVANLSGGQRQRVALGQTLLQKRPILLLDEPFKGLDAALQHTISAFIKNYISVHKVIGLLSTHEKNILASATYIV